MQESRTTATIRTNQAQWLVGLVGGIALGIVACGDSNTVTGPAVAAKKGEGPGHVALAPESATLEMGELLSLTGQVINPAGHVAPNQPLEFFSSDETVVVVESIDGAGTAIITATRNNRSGTAAVVVREARG